MTSVNALRRRVASLECRPIVEPIAMSDLELARRIEFVRASEGRDLLTEVAPVCLPFRPLDGDQVADRQLARSNGRARSERLT